MRLQLSNLSYKYNSQTPLRFPNLSLGRDENLLILGPSGSGKSTLLHLMSALLTPHSGEVLIDGENPNLLNTAKRDAFRSENISLVWQKSFFVEALSLRENLNLAQKLSTKKQDSLETEKLCDALQVKHLLHKKPKELSLGEQQRFSIIRAALSKPKLILADEPTSALDDENAQRVGALLLETAAKTQASLVVVTHDVRLKSLFTKTLQL